MILRYKLKDDGRIIGLAIAELRGGLCYLRPGNLKVAQ